MYKIYMLILLIISSLPVNGQQLILFAEIGSFQSASSVSINQAGFIFVSDAGSNEIVKMDTLGNVIRTIGGYGWSGSAFDYPVKLFANTLNVYVADRNNDRIQIFDKDLNYLSEISSRKFSNNKAVFRYPLSVSVNSQGDLYILDSDNTRILRFNFRGEYLNEIGGYESSSYVLGNPKCFTINSTNQLNVIDGKNLIVFDQFGNLVKSLKLDEDYVNINFSSNILFLIGDRKIDILDWNSNPPKNSFSNFLDEKIIDAILFNKKLFVLTEKKLYVYQIQN